MPIACTKQTHKLILYSGRNRCVKCLIKKAKVYRRKNRVHQRELGKMWRANNREKSNQLAQKYWVNTKSFIWGLKSNPCFDCDKWLAPWQMQFDHLPRFKKKKEINAAWSGTDKDLFDELSKCQLVCSNCHENRSYFRRFSNASR